MSTRQQKQFWAITEWNTIKEVPGYKCPQEGVWWVPSLGFSLTEGHHLFNTQDAAKARLKYDLRNQINELELQLAALG